MLSSASVSSCWQYMWNLHMIEELKLKTALEKYIYDMLIEMDGHNEMVRYINRIFFYGMCILILTSRHVETVVLLSQLKPHEYIEANLELRGLDVTSAEIKATYKEIQDYVLEKYSLKVSNFYISQVKQKCGLEVAENYNLPKLEHSRQPKCQEEKERAIKDALEHFGMV